MTRAYIGVGSNVGDRAAFCRRAVESLRTSPGISVGAISSLYETSPVGGPPQRSFVNLVVEIETQVSARELLGVCKEIERRLGREPGEIRWGPRVADLDILTYGEDKVNEPDLEIPHPRLTSRRFVLIPLLEMDPAAADPWGARYADFLDEAEGDV
ncbi:MAG: 2-amino-4-hydroxy-6-hydroxymethyldihydropteridine diphosphokinase, partial [Actinomycetota bacterium]|nr:2-amino-4-hydroxy-6-hydroxymethyldihydropteridine diphosphokinase [Actinomycetota bacterium]